MNQKTKESLAFIALLPEDDRKRALSAAKIAGRVYSKLEKKGATPIRDTAYEGENGQAGGKKNLEEILAIMGVEITGGTGGQGNKKIASIKKITLEKAKKAGIEIIGEGLK